MKNKSTISAVVSVLFAASMITACTERDGSPAKGIENGGNVSKTDIGVAAGVVTGGLVGSAIGGGVGNTIAIIGGGLLGGILGHEIGSSLDQADRAEYDRASQNAMETGKTRKWKNADTGHYGTISPRKSYVDDQGSKCRKYTQTIVIDGTRHTGHGIACREEDGSWKIVE